MMISAKETEAAASGEKIVIWVHGDHIGSTNTALQRYPNAAAVFVFDEDFIGLEKFSFGRLFFLYESVLDLFQARRTETPNVICSVRRGSVVAEVLAFAREQEAARIVTTDTLGSRFASYKDAMEQTLPVDALPVPPLVPYDPAHVPRRFTVWWRDVEDKLCAERRRRWSRYSDDNYHGFAVASSGRKPGAA